MRVLAVVQARLGSTRLPGKALLHIAGRAMLCHVLARARAIPHVDGIVLATTINPEDDALVDVAGQEGVPSFRGSVDDVLDRFHSAVLAHPAGAILRVTADCPLLDPQESGRVVAEYLSHQDSVDYVSNVEPATYPDGLDTEIFSRDALERTWSEASLPSDREHVTTYMRRAQDIRRHNVPAPNGVDLSSLRWTVDEPRDLAFVRAVWSELSPDGARIFGMSEVLALLRKRQELAVLNRGIPRNEGLARSQSRDAIARSITGIE